MLSNLRKAMRAFLNRNETNAAIVRAQVTHRTGTALLLRAKRLRSERNRLERLPAGSFGDAEATICESLFHDEKRARYFASLHFQRRDDHMDSARQFAIRPRKPPLFFKGVPT